MASLFTCLLLAGIASLALAAPGGSRIGGTGHLNATRECHYTVQTDDNCLFIATNLFGITYDELIKLNTKSLAKRDIFPGEKLRVPCRDQLHVAPVKVPDACRKRHTFEAGDSCAALSIRFNIAAHVLQAYNDLDWQCALRVGQQLCVSKNEPPLCTLRHTVVSGDTCYDLAKSKGVTLSDLKAWNPDLINDRCAIRPGHTVCVKAYKPAETTAAVLTIRAAPTTRTSEGAAPTIHRASTVVSPSSFSTSLVVSGTRVKPRTRVISDAAAAADAPSTALAADTGEGFGVYFSDLLHEAGAQVKQFLLSFAGNLTRAPPASGDDQIMLPSRTQLRGAPEALPSDQADEAAAIAKTSSETGPIIDGYDIVVGYEFVDDEEDGKIEDDDDDEDEEEEKNEDREEEDEDEDYSVLGRER